MRQVLTLARLDGGAAFAKQSIVSPESFLYPLDAIGSWNKGYGRRGFIQYQCVLPDASGHRSVRAFMELVTTAETLRTKIARLEEMVDERDRELSRLKVVRAS